MKTRWLKEEDDAHVDNVAAPDGNTTNQKENATMEANFQDGVNESTKASPSLIMAHTNPLFEGSEISQDTTSVNNGKGALILYDDGSTTLNEDRERRRAGGFCGDPSEIVGLNHIDEMDQENTTVTYTQSLGLGPKNGLPGLLISMIVMGWNCRGLGSPQQFVFFVSLLRFTNLMLFCFLIR